MKKFNLKKMASAEDSVISDKAIQANRENMNLSNDQQNVVGKNINLSLPVKNKDNTVPFNAQLQAARKNTETEPSITEAGMDKKEVNFGDKTEGVMPINVKTEEYNQQYLDDFKKAEDSSKKDTTFWDKYVGVQLEGEGMPTKVKNNIPDSASQIANNPARFKGKDVNKLVMASIKDADAMLFHIYAQAANENRSLNKEEQQQIVDINSGKTRLIAEMIQPFKRSLEYSVDPKFRKEKGKVRVYEADGTPIDEFKSCEEAKTNYPEGEIESV